MPVSSDGILYNAKHVACPCGFRVPSSEINPISGLRFLDLKESHGTFFIGPNSLQTFIFAIVYLCVLYACVMVSAHSPGSRQLHNSRISVNKFPLMLQDSIAPVGRRTRSKRFFFFCSFFAIFSEEVSFLTYILFQFCFNFGSSSFFVSDLSFLMNSDFSLRILRLLFSKVVVAVAVLVAVAECGVIILRFLFRWKRRRRIVQFLLVRRHSCLSSILQMM